MAVLQMLAEVIRTEEFLCVVALAKLVHCSQVLETTIPIGLWQVGKFLTTVAANIVR